MNTQVCQKKPGLSKSLSKRLADQLGSYLAEAFL